MRRSPIRGELYEQELKKAINSDVYLVEEVLLRKGNPVQSWINSDNILKWK